MADEGGRAMERGIVSFGGKCRKETDEWFPKSDLLPNSFTVPTYSPPLEGCYPPLADGGVVFFIPILPVFSQDSPLYPFHSGGKVCLFSVGQHKKERRVFPHLSFLPAPTGAGCTAMGLGFSVGHFLFVGLFS